MQITAEQILREAKELQEQDFKPPKQKISDPAELAEYRLRKRKEYEDLVRRVRWNLSIWIRVSLHQLALHTCHALHCPKMVHITFGKIIMQRRPVPLHFSGNAADV